MALLSANNTFAADQGARAEQEENLPSVELLEFLAEFDDTDDETFELVVYHGLRDSEQLNSEEDRDQSDPEPNRDNE